MTLSFSFNCIREFGRLLKETPYFGHICVASSRTHNLRPGLFVINRPSIQMRLKIKAVAYEWTWPFALSVIQPSNLLSPLKLHQENTWRQKLLTAPWSIRAGGLRHLCSEQSTKENIPDFWNVLQNMWMTNVVTNQFYGDFLNAFIIHNKHCTQIIAAHSRHVCKSWIRFAFRA